MTDWPETLPQFLSLNDFNQAEPDGVLRSQMDDGPDILSLQSLSNAAPLTGSMPMSPGQYADLQEFYTSTVKKVMPFNFPKVGGGTWVLRFTAPPKRQGWIATKYRVQLSFEIVP